MCIRLMNMPELILSGSKGGGLEKKIYIKLLNTEVDFSLV